MSDDEVSSHNATRAESRGVQSIEVGARLINALVDEGEPMMLKDLARLAGFAPAQAHAYLVSFRKIGLVDQDAESGRYKLGRFAIELGVTRMRTAEPMRMACDAVNVLVRQTGLIAAIVVWGSFGPTVVQVQESGSQLNMNTRPGTVYSMSGTASGRLFSAFMPEAVVKDAIRAERKSAGSTSRVGQHRFMSRVELDQIRHDGYATIDNPPVPGIKAISAPVFDHIGQLVLAITIIGDEHLIEDRAETVFIPELLDATRRLSSDLGYTQGRFAPAIT